MWEPSLTKIGGSLASVSSVVSRRGASSCSTTTSPLRAGNRHRDDLLARCRPSSIAATAQLVRADRPAVHVRARDLELGGDLGRLLRHVLAAPRALEAVAEHRVQRGRVAQAHAEAHTGEQVGRVRHRLHPAAETDLDVAGADRESSSETARIPEAQTLLIVSELIVIGMPAFACAWREGIIPWPAWSTVPITTCSTCSGSTPARSSAPAIATAPRLGASSGASAPPSLPIGVRALPRITVAGIGYEEAALKSIACRRDMPRPRWR